MLAPPLRFQIKENRHTRFSKTKLHLFTEQTTLLPKSFCFPPLSNVNNVTHTPLFHNIIPHHGLPNEGKHVILTTRTRTSGTHYIKQI